MAMKVLPAKTRTITVDHVAAVMAERYDIAREQEQRNQSERDAQEKNSYGEVYYMARTDEAREVQNRIMSMARELRILDELEEASAYENVRSFR